MRQVFIGVAASLIAATTAFALSVTDGEDASDLIGQADYVTGFADGQATPAAPDSAVKNRFFNLGRPDYDAQRRRFFVPDIHNHRVLVFDLSSGIPDDMQPAYVLGQPDFVTGGADPNNLYGNTNTQNPINGCTTTINACGAGRIMAVAYDASRDYLYATDIDNSRVLVWDVAPASIQNGAAAVAVLGQHDLVSDEQRIACGSGPSATPTACSIKQPYAVSYDGAADRLYVSDSADNRVLVFDLSAGLSNGMAADNVLGQPDFVTKTPNTACGGGSAGVPNACGIEGYVADIYPQGNQLFVADGNNSRILVYDLSAGLSNGMAAANVLGQPDFATVTEDTACGGGSAGAPNACGFGPFGSPDSMAMDEVSSILYVVDGWNHRVLVFDLSAGLSNGMAAANVLGQPNFSVGFTWDASYGAASPPTKASLLGASGALFDAQNDRLFVADSGNNRILTYGLSSGDSPVVIQGGTGSTSTDNGDGTSTVVTTTQDDNAFEVTLPNNAAPIGTNTAVEIVVSGGNHPSITIAAYLAGGNKSVKMPWSADDVCIDDSPGGSIDSQGSCNAPKVRIRKKDLNAVGDCVVWEDSDTICRIDSDTLEISGLEHSTLYAVIDSDDDGAPDDDDACPGTDLQGPIPTNTLRTNHQGDAEITADGCNCSQILEIKPGANNGEKKFGCTQGTLSVWATSQWQ